MAASYRRVCLRAGISSAGSKRSGRCQSPWHTTHARYNSLLIRMRKRPCGQLAPSERGSYNLVRRSRVPQPMAQSSAPNTRIQTHRDAERTSTPSGTRHVVLLVLVLALGLFARTWEYGRLPPSLNPDEASAGVEALNLLRFGQDRNGIAFPVKFISWGSGQDVLYAYLLIPLIATTGLSPIATRLPMLLLALASLPLTYVATRRIFGYGGALTATFMLAISPWHILLSRWALDSNLFPIVFLAGFVCLLWVRKNGWWFVPACLLMAICLYAYGTAYLVIPIFMAGAIILMVREGCLRPSQLWTGLVAHASLAVPIYLLLIVNWLGLDSIRLGPFTVPRFPVAVRWESATLLGAPELAEGLFTNVFTALRLLITESDAISYNVVEPFGIFYRCTLLLAIAGVIIILTKQEWRLESALLLLWVGAAACVAPLSAVNINRFNIIFLPLIMLGARALCQLQPLHRALGPLTVSALLAAFSAFTLSYHGNAYRSVADFKFQNGLIPALYWTEGHAEGPICVTDKINMPYIYALFTDPTSPVDFQASVKYIDPTEPLRRVASYGRYTFGTAHCPDLENTTYVLTGQEIPPRMGNRYAYEFFDNFVVYSPVR